MMDKKGPKLQGTPGEKASGLIVVAAASDWTKPVFGLILIDPVRFWCRCRGLALPFGVNYLSSKESHGPGQAWWVAKPGLGRMEKRRLHCSTESTLAPPQKRRLHYSTKIAVFY